MQITVGNTREYSITLVFGSWSYSSHVSTRIALSNCGSQSSQIQHRCQKVLFWSFLADSRTTTHQGVSTAWWGVYVVFVIAPFTRWCRSAAWTRNVCFPPIAMLLGKLSLPTLEPIHIIEPLIKSLREDVLLWPISFPWNSEWKIFIPTTWIFFFEWIVGTTELNPILIPLI
jgi:hypothetical protein